ncbi:hypothetical protein GCM10008955_31510 [Deinococcus malanensis]|uniref:DUF898 domain-containing protein n=2 Tax=Deinococcus malanensis TaxID=1706855 RepID=A0ABQ2F0M8_9DEIO|nr:YjgN family protein [Deinococcus malanensis]GGK35313.1 hypothetical protein GCM10008955_31510 [Deinococcus malanensis]
MTQVLPSTASGQAPVLLEDPATPGAAPHVQHYPMSFTGQAGEYFRLWIVNTALTIVTLGVYLPWARVRQRQYFYGHTWLDGQNFEYTANPLALLRGYLAIGLAFGLYSLSTTLKFSGWEYVAGTLGVVYVLLYPWLVMKSLGFLAVSSVHRGLRFRHHANTGQAYVAYGLANIAAGLTAGLALPWAWYRQRRYQVECAAYGSARATFRGDVGDFYVIGLVGVGLTVAGGLILAALVGTLALAGLGERVAVTSGLDNIALVGIAAAYLAILAVYGVTWQYVRASTMRYVLNHVEVGGVVRVTATFRPWVVVWIAVSNAVVQALTLGLATPWAAVRRARYITQEITVRAIAPLDEFASGSAVGESSLGEAATELLDINVGF